MLKILLANFKVFLVRSPNRERFPAGSLQVTFMQQATKYSFTSIDILTRGYAKMGIRYANFVVSARPWESGESMLVLVLFFVFPFLFSFVYDCSFSQQD